MIFKETNICDITAKQKMHAINKNNNNNCHIDNNNFFTIKNTDTDFGIL